MGNELSVSVTVIFMCIFESGVCVCVCVCVRVRASACVCVWVGGGTSNLIKNIYLIMIVSYVVQQEPYDEIRICCIHNFIRGVLLIYYNIV